MENTLSRAERARRAGLKPDTVYNRLRRGWSKEDALSTPWTPPALTLARANQKRYLNSVSAKARAAGLNPSTALSRIRSGWPEERVFVPVPVPLTPSRAERARNAGLNPQTVKMRITKLGWNESDALTVPAWGRPVPTRSENKASVYMRQHNRRGQYMVAELLGRKVTQKEAREFLRSLKHCLANSNLTSGERREAGLPISDGLADKTRAAGLSLNAVRTRIYQGWSEERALSTPVAHHKDSISAKARAAGLSRALVCRRLKAGWSKEDAFSSPVDTDAVLC